MDNLVSVIVPVYNLGNLVGRTLSSIINQTYKNLEIIVVNDGSTDNSAEIVSEYAKKDSRIICINKNNEGVSAARLTGVKLSHGDWIAFVDADDVLEEDMYEFLLGLALENGADIAHCGYQRIFPDGHITYFYNTGKQVLQDRRTGIKDLLEGSFVDSGIWNKLFNRKLFDHLLSNHCMNLNIKINEDLLMNFYLFQQSQKSVYIDQCKYKYMVRDESASRRKLNYNKIYDPIKAKEEILTHAGEDELQLARKAYVSTCINVYNMIIVEGRSCNLSDAEKIRELIKGCEESVHLLGKRKRASVFMIVRCPRIYKQLYRLYEKKFQKNLYR